MAGRSISNTTDDSRQKPRLRCYLNLASLEGIEPRPSFLAIKEAGFEGVQFNTPSDSDTREECRRLGLGLAGSGRISVPHDATVLAQLLKEEGMECGTVHLGWGLESEREGCVLIDALLDSVARFGIPIYVETHRATLFQDMWRTVEFATKFPELRFNGDFSHWYTGLEMVYGGFERKFAFLAPILERVRFLHGRIGNPGCIQVEVSQDESQQPLFVEHFRQLWTASMKGFLASAQPGDYLCFTPELLPARIYYARQFRNRAGTLEEESDRWEQSLLLASIAKRCFESASTERANESQGA